MSEINELQTLRDIIRWATSRFNEAGLYYGHGTETAWDEAFALVLHTLHLPHDISILALDARVTERERTQLDTLIQKRIKDRIPVPYLTHEAWFAEMPFFVDERVLIPRSPIAEMIQHQFRPWMEKVHVENILDLCTGSACIAIACAKAFADAHVDASDISVDALAVAKINVLRHGVEDQVELHQSDLFKQLPIKKYDIIVSNPPYVDAEDMADLPAEFLHEPKLALAAGNLGLDYAVKILQMADQYLSENGILVVEVGNSEFALAEQFPEIPFTWMEFQNGGGGVFMLTAKELRQSKKFLANTV